MSAWSELDLGLMRARYAELGPVRVGLLLGRPASAVRNKAWRMGLTGQNGWTAADDAFLREWYADSANLAPGFLDRLAVAMGRSRAAVALRASRIGLSDIKRKVPDAFKKGPRKPKHATQEARNQSVRDAIRKRLQEKGHPRGYGPDTHSEEARAKISARVRSSWADPTSGFNEESYRQQQADRIARTAVTRVHESKEANYSRALRGRRPDLGDVFFRSRWEANYARYLNFLIGIGQVVRWEYEPRTFWFEKIRRGVRSYTPDFQVWLPGDCYEWHEVKGWMDAKSLTKLKRMRRYYPKEKVVLVGEEWFKNASKIGLTRTIPGWESRRVSR